MKIQSAADLQAFMTKHGLTNVDVALCLGYSINQSRHTSQTVQRMRKGEYNWTDNAKWVTKKLNKLIQK